MNKPFLGAFDTIQNGGVVVELPTDTDTTGGVNFIQTPGAGDISLEQVDVTPVPLPAPVSKENYVFDQPGTTYPPPYLRNDPNYKPETKKKNMLIWGIGGLVLAYLLFRKK